MRGQLQVLVVGGGDRRGRLRRDELHAGERRSAAWTVQERVGAIVLAFGLVIAADVTVAHHSYEWFIGTHFWHRAFTYGLWAFGALAIGLGVLPVLFALAWAFGGPVSTREDRALLGLLVGAVAGFGLYTAVKASYISTHVRDPRRGAQPDLPEPRRLRRRGARRAAAAHPPRAARARGRGHRLPDLVDAVPRLRAPLLRRLRPLDPAVAEPDLVLDGVATCAGCSSGSSPPACSSHSRRASAHAPGAPIAIAILVLGLATIAWNLTGEISAANQAVAPAKFQRSLLPDPARLDRPPDRPRTHDVHRQGASRTRMPSGRSSSGTSRSRTSGRSTHPRPRRGRRRPRTSSTPTARSDPQLPLDWVVAPPGIDMVGLPVEQAGGLTLYRVSHPIRMSSFVSGITLDGWMQEQSRFVRFAPKPRTRHRHRLALADSRLRRPAGPFHLPCLESADRRATASRLPGGCSMSSKPLHRRAS